MESNTKSEIGAPGERKRRHHQRSRNGCVSCKSSHMRCDEGKPICRNCLKYGRSCGYTRGRGLASDQPLVKASNEAPESLFSPHLNQRPNSLLDTPLALNLTTAYPGKTPMLVSRSPLMSAIGVGMLDPFNGFPIPLSANSNLLLDHCEFKHFFAQSQYVELDFKDASAAVCRIFPNNWTTSGQEAIVAESCL
ncbi:uncharacterized protein LY89DRAFT_464954 [Mollisia scopiformis]|uniref:Zn(2)-C6 fungal-type domain-containing protein n=1 Tax=Mollisia scopiformis TaxID=149040 RepID=A0A194XIA9_MOLSC|nr:uncharacterized protein LY89DRAFT_464954 [Mollisia scopiformis]KUJ19898.1 hypothetical protein LY89DRAFT_464954 [Mollisia scopiformis]